MYFVKIDLIESFTPFTMNVDLLTRYSELLHDTPGLDSLEIDDYIESMRIRMVNINSVTIKIKNLIKVNRINLKIKSWEFCLNKLGKVPNFMFDIKQLHDCLIRKECQCLHKHIKDYLDIIVEITLTLLDFLYDYRRRKLEVDYGCECYRNFDLGEYVLGDQYIKFDDEEILDNLFKLRL